MGIGKSHPKETTSNQNDAKKMCLYDQNQDGDSLFGCFQTKNRGGKHPKSSHFNRGFPVFSPSILGVFPLFLVQHPFRSLPVFRGFGFGYPQESYNTHPDIAHPATAIPRATPTMKGIPAYSPLAKVCSKAVFQFGVLKQP